MIKQKLGLLKSKFWLLTPVVALVFICLFFIITPVNHKQHNSTGINEQINFQGRLLTSTGAVVPDGTYNMRFKIYQDGDGVLGGGDESLKWTETRESGNKVTVKNGYFSVYLGSVTALTGIDWNQSVLWLSIDIGGTGTPTYDGEMSPFTRLGSTPYALNSKQLGGIASTGFVQIGPSAAQGDASTNNSIFINKTTGTGNILELQKSGTDVFNISNTGAIVSTYTSTSSTAASEYAHTINLTDTGAVTTGTDDTKGLAVNVTRTGASATAVPVTYGVYSLAIGDTGGTSTLVGVEGVAGGGDSNYGVAGAGVATGSATLTETNGVIGSITSLGFTGTATTVNAIQGAIDISTAGTYTTASGLLIKTATNSGGVGTISTNYGAWLQAQTVGASDYGLRVDAADTQTLWISGNADNTTAAAGIAFGASRDTTLYRSAANTLKTDGDLALGSNPASAGILRIPNNSIIKARNAANSADQTLLYLDTSNQTHIDSGAGTFIYAGGTQVIKTLSNRVEMTRPLLVNNTSSTLGTNEKFRVTDVTTVDNLANVQIGTSATTAKGLVVQGVASQTGNLTEWQSSTGAMLAQIGSTGKLSIGNSALGSNALDVYTAASGAIAQFQSNGAVNGGKLVAYVLGNAVTGSVYGSHISGSTTGNLYQTIQQNGNGSAVFDALVLGTGDAKTTYSINGGQSWGVGLDNSDSAKFKISNGGSLGSNDYFAISTAGLTAIGSGSPANGVLTVGTATTTAAGGIYFGTDTNLYRSAADTLKTDDSLNVGTNLVVAGHAAFGSSGTVQSGTVIYNQETSTATSGAFKGQENQIYMNAAINSSAVAAAADLNLTVQGTGINYTGTQYGVTGTVNIDTTGTATTVIGLQGLANNRGAGTITGGYGSAGLLFNTSSGTVTSGAGLGASIYNTSTGTIGTAQGLLITSAVNSGGGTITNNYGLNIQAQTAGTNDYGARIDAADTQTLWLSGNADNTTAAAGIAFGSSRDTDLYRSAANTLKTDTALVVGTNLSVASGSPTSCPNLGGTCNSLINSQQTFTSTTTPIAGTYTDVTLNPSGAESAAANAAGIFQIQTQAGNVQNFAGVYDLVGTYAGATHHGSGTVGNAFGSYIGVQNDGGGTITNAVGQYIVMNNSIGTIGTGYGIYANLGFGTATTAYGIDILANSGTITNNYGISVAAQTAGTNDYGVAVGAADTQTLWLSSDADNTTANAGIAFGASRDTTLYRSAAATLATGATTFSLTGASGTISTATTNAALTLQSNGTGALTLDSGSTGDINIGTNANAKTITIGNATGATAVSVNCGTGACNFGSNATAHSTVLGSSTGASITFIHAGTAGLSIGDDALANTIRIGNSSGAVNQTIYVGTSAAASSSTSVTIGSAIGASPTYIQAGTWGINIGNNGVANTLQIGNTTGAVSQTINIGNNSTASSTNNVNIGSSIAGTVAVTGPTTITNRTSGSTDTLIVSNSTSTGNIANFKDNSTVVFTIADGGAILAENSTNSTNAFQVQNSSGGQLFNIDSTNSIISLNSNNTGQPQAWSTNANSLNSAVGTNRSIIANGYIYSVGGYNATAQTTVEYAKINADGSTGTWATTSALPSARMHAGIAYANGYVYLVSGWTGAAASNTVYYAKQNADGTLASWQTNSNTVPANGYGGGSFVLNGYLYWIGGNTASVYYAKLNPDGSTQAWQTNANSLPATRVGSGVTTANGYAYVLGGSSSSTVYYAKINTDGSIGSWTTNTNSLADPRNYPGAFAANGYVYTLGGIGSLFGTSNTGYFAQINSDGSLGSFSTTTVTLPATRENLGTAYANGYVYAVGGFADYTTTSPTSTVYYTSLSRIKVSGSLDLLAGSVNDAFGGVNGGGTLRAGNTTIAGTLQVQDQANFNSTVGVVGNLSVGGDVKTNSTLLVQTATNSTTAFQVADSSGTSILNVDTSNSRVGIGNSAPGAALEVTGDIYLTKEANRTVKIVDSTTSNTAGGNLTLQAGAGNGTSAAGGSVTIQAGSSGSTTSAGGSVSIAASAGVGAAGGNVNITAGSASGAAGGSVNITAGAGFGAGGITITPGCFFTACAATQINNNNGRVVLGAAGPTSKLSVVGTVTTDSVIIGRGAASQTADLFQLQTSTPTTVFSVGATGAVLSQNSSDSSNAFTVKDQGAQQLLNIDTSARSGSGGNLVKVGDSSGTDTATTILQLDGTTADPTTNLSALNGGLFYNSTTNKVSIIENGIVKALCNAVDASCGAGATTLQGAYNGGNTITTTDARDISVTLADTATDSNFLVNVATGSTGKFAVQNAGTDLLSVTSSTIGLAAANVNLGVSGGTTVTPAGNLTFAEGNTKGITLQSDLSGGARSSSLLTLTQANDATNNNTTPLLQITQSDTASTSTAITITQSSTAAVNAVAITTSSTTAGVTVATPAGGTGYAVTGATSGTAFSGTSITTGTGLAATAITTGKAVNIAGTGFTTGSGILFNTTANAVTSGKAINITGAASAVTADFSGQYISVTPTRTQTAAATRADTSNFLNLTRSITTNNASAVYNLSGALANLQSSCTQTLGTCNDSSNIINVGQNYANSTGDVINVVGAGTGNLATFDASNSSANGVSIDVQSSSSSQFALKVTSNNGSTNGLYVRADGNVGIDNASPGYILHVGSSSVTTGTTVARFENAGGTCDVTPSTAGGVTCTSDVRLKKDITDYGDALSKLMGVNVINYHYLAEDSSSLTHTGFSAQQLQGILPDLVNTDNNGYLSVSYAGVTPYLVKAIQQQQSQISDVQQQVTNTSGSNNLASLNVSGATTLASLSVSGATTTGSLVVTGNAQIGTLTVTTAISTPSLTVSGTANVGTLNVSGNATVAGNITIQGHVLGNDDTRGTVTIPAGATEVKFTFVTPYNKVPYVTVSQKGTPQAIFYSVSSTTEKDFTITINSAQATPIDFNYQVQE